MSLLDKKYGLNRNSLYNEALAPDAIQLDTRSLSELMAQAVVISRNLPFYHSPNAKITVPNIDIYFNEKILIDIFQIQSEEGRFSKFPGEIENEVAKLNQQIEQLDKTNLWQALQDFKETNSNEYKKIIKRLKYIYTTYLKHLKYPLNEQDKFDDDEYKNIFEGVRLLTACCYDKQGFEDYIDTEAFEVQGWEKILMSDTSFILAYLENYRYLAEYNEIMYEISRYNESDGDNADKLHKQLLYSSLNHIINILRTYNCLSETNKNDDFIEIEVKKELKISIKEKIIGVLHSLISSFLIKGIANTKLKDARFIYNETIDIIKTVTKIPSRHFKNTLEKKRDHDPSTGLLIAFLKTFRLIQDELGNISYEFIKYYYQKLLDIKRLPPIADKTYISVKLASHVDSTLIPKGTEIEIFSKKHNKTYTYEVIEETQVNRAKLKHLKTTYIKRTFDKIDYVIQDEFDNENTSKENTFRLFGGEGSSNMPDTVVKNNVGFMVASPALLMRSGKRTIFLHFILNKDDERKVSYERSGGNDQFISTDDGKIQSIFPINIQLTHGEQWIKNETPHNPLVFGDEKSKTWISEIVIRIELSENDAPLVGNKQLTGFSHLPTVKIMLENNADEAGARLFFDCFSNVKEISLGVEATGVEVFGDEDNTFHLVNGENYFPFTMIPTIGKMFRIYNQEVHCKNLNSIKFHLIWATLPRDLKDYYASYISELSNLSGEVIAYENYKVKVSSSIGGNNTKKSKTLFIDQPTDTKVKGNEKDKNRPDTKEVNNKENDSLPPIKINEKRTIHIDRKDLVNLNGGKDYYTKSLINRDSYYEFELTGSDNLPLHPFLHDKYNRVLEAALFDRSQKVFNKNKDEEGKEDPENIPSPDVNEPFTPALSGVSLDYSSIDNNESDEKTEDQKNDESDKKIEDQKIDVLQLLPFETRLSGKNESPLPIKYFKDNGYLMLGFSNIQPEETITVFFELSNISIATKKIYEYPELHYQYWTKNGWKSTETSDCIKIDETQEFTQSGIITFMIPKDATPKIENNEEIFYIQITTTGDTTLFSTLVNYTEQSISVQRKLQKEEEYHYLSIPLQDTITSIKQSNSDIEQLTMLVETYGGKSTENDETYLHRISDQLYSKNRLVTRNDFERFILNNFSEVHAVRCLLPGTYTDIFDKKRKGKGKDILIVVMPEISDYYNKTTPRFNYKYLKNIENKIRTYTTDGISLSVINPVYLHLEIMFKKTEGLNSVKEKIADKLYALWNESPDKKIGQLPPASQILSIISELTPVQKDVRFIWSQGERAVFTKLENAKYYNESEFPYGVLVYGALNTMIKESKTLSSDITYYNYQEVKDITKIKSDGEQT